MEFDRTLWSDASLLRLGNEGVSVKFRRMLSAVSWTVVVWGCLSSAGIGAAAAAAMPVDIVAASKSAVTEAITTQSLPLKTDASSLAIKQIAVQDSSRHGLRLVEVPVEHSGGVVQFVVDDMAQIVDYAEKLVTRQHDGTRAVAVWQDGVQRQNGQNGGVRPIAGDPFTNCLEAEGNRGKIAKAALQKCYSGTLISPVQGAACLLGLGVSEDVIDKCQKLAMA